MQSSNITASFTTLSSNNLADVAARVVEEFRHQNGGGDYDDDDTFNFNDYGYDNNIIHPEKTEDENNCDPDDFQFDIICTDVNSSSIYPLFDRSLLLDVDPTDCKPSSTAVRVPLRKLFSEDRDFGSSSSSEADDLDGITAGTYCVWNPKTQSPERCNKSNSTGNSSRRWKFRDILYRSNSDSFFKPLIATTNKKINNEKAKKVENKAENRGGAFTTGSRSNRILHLL